MKKWKLSLVLLFCGISMVFVYQNCSNVRLSPYEKVTLASTSNGGDICSLPSLSSTDKVKLTFVVDMSASNATTPVRTEIMGSDVERQRLAIIRNFLSKDCLKANDKTRVAVVGFANKILIPGGSLCDRNQYKPVSDYLNPSVSDSIDYLETVHDRTKQDCTVGGGTCSEYTTKYDQGVECAKQIVDDDIGHPDADGKRAFYMTFFLTDGEPTIDGVPSYDITNPQYLSMKNLVKLKIRDMRNLAEEKALGLTLRPIFYGGDYLRRKDSTGGKEAVARDILTTMANEGLTEYIYMDTIGQLDLCKYLVSGTRVPYKLKQLVITNLTTVKKGKKLLLDSDMDGIPDDEEAARGFDPAKARSMVPDSQLLDGFCGGLNATQCVNSAHANCGKPNALGLTLCETSKWGLTDGLDTDRDDFIDIMEVIKGSSPSIPVGYVDGDPMSEFDELMVGRDPHFPDDDTPGWMLTQFRRWPLSTPLPGCPADQDSIHYSIDYTPLLPTLATYSNDPVSQQLPWMNHGKNVNVIMIYYILTPASQSLRQELKDQVYVKYMKVHTNGVLIEQSGFVKAGELNDNFAEFTGSWK